MDQGRRSKLFFNHRNLIFFQTTLVEKGKQVEFSLITLSHLQ